MKDISWVCNIMKNEVVSLFVKPLPRLLTEQDWILFNGMSAKHPNDTGILVLPADTSKASYIAFRSKEANWIFASFNTVGEAKERVKPGGFNLPLVLPTEMWCGIKG